MWFTLLPAKPTRLPWIDGSVQLEFIVQVVDVRSVLKLRNIVDTGSGGWDFGGSSQSWTICRG